MSECIKGIQFLLAAFRTPAGSPPEAAGKTLHKDPPPGLQAPPMLQILNPQLPQFFSQLFVYVPKYGSKDQFWQTESTQKTGQSLQRGRKHKRAIVLSQEKQKRFPAASLVSCKVERRQRSLRFLSQDAKKQGAHVFLQ